MKTVKTICVSVLFALLLCPGAPGLAQYNANPNYKSQHKIAQRYQKSIQKQRKKQLRQEKKTEQKIRKQHKK